MARTRRGFPVNNVDLVTIGIPGTRTRVTVKAGLTAELLRFYAWAYHRNVARIDRIPDDGAYNRRKVRGGVSWSEHAAGTALDLNWSEHPLGARTHSPAQVRTIHRIVGYTLGSLEWGGVWRRPDEMHVECTNRNTENGVRRVRAIMYPRLALGSTGRRVGDVRRALRVAHRPGFAQQFDPDVMAAVRNYQAAHGLAVDGVVGPQTWKSLHI